MLLHLVRPLLRAAVRATASIPKRIRVIKPKTRSSPPKPLPEVKEDHSPSPVTEQHDIMGGGGSKPEAKATGVGQLQTVSNQLSVILDKDEKERIEDEVRSELPFHTNTLLMCAGILFFVGLTIFLVVRLMKARQYKEESGDARAAKRLNIEAGVGAPRCVVGPVPAPPVPYSLKEIAEVAATLSK